MIYLKKEGTVHSQAWKVSPKHRSGGKGTLPNLGSEPSPYRKFSQYLKDKFGCKVYKVSVDAGFDCPNRDGKLSKAGCIFCDNKAFSFNSRFSQKPLKKQIEDGIAFGKNRYAAEKFIIYFQANTNTYAPVCVLKEKYDTVKEFGDIAGISIGTRPDCVNDEILDLIASYASDYDVWVEYGLQSIHKKSLEFLNRNHSYEDFLDAVRKAKKRNIKICAHVIIGLPNETKDEILQTAKELARLKIDGVKIHPLYIVKGTSLEALFRSSVYKPLELDEFVNLAAAFLENLSPDTVVQRIGADCPPEMLVEPSWILEKERVLNMLDEKLRS
ncbi:MAG: TIGR01212 family radical SAM protein [Candidatus Omnitrophota bacterium]